MIQSPQTHICKNIINIRLNLNPSIPTLEFVYFNLSVLPPHVSA